METIQAFGQSDKSQFQRFCTLTQSCSLVPESVCVGGVICFKLKQQQVTSATHRFNSRWDINWWCSRKIKLKTAGRARLSGSCSCCPFVLTLHTWGKRKKPGLVLCPPPNQPLRFVFLDERSWSSTIQRGNFPNSELTEQNYFLAQDEGGGVHFLQNYLSEILPGKKNLLTNSRFIIWEDYLTAWYQWMEYTVFLNSFYPGFIYSVHYQCKK